MLANFIWSIEETERRKREAEAVARAAEHAAFRIKIGLDTGRLWTDDEAAAINRAVRRRP